MSAAKPRSTALRPGDVVARAITMDSISGERPMVLGGSSGGSCRSRVELSAGALGRRGDRAELEVDQEHAGKLGGRRSALKRPQSRPRDHERSERVRAHRGVPQRRRSVAASRGSAPACARARLGSSFYIACARERNASRCLRCGTVRGASPRWGCEAARELDRRGGGRLGGDPRRALGSCPGRRRRRVVRPCSKATRHGGTFHRACLLCRCPHHVSGKRPGSQLMLLC